MLHICIFLYKLYTIFIKFFSRIICIFIINKKNRNNFRKKINSYFYSKIDKISTYLLKKILYNKKIPKILSVEESIQYIIDNKCSCCRLGDGELNNLLYKSIPFQKKNKILAKKLKNIFSNYNNQKILVCINEELFNKKAHHYFKDLIIFDYKILLPLILKNNFYGETNLTRFYDFKMENINKSIQLFNLLKKIWENRNILIVEGEFSRIGVNNDLFDKCNSVRRILCPKTNAFDKYDEIFKTVKEKAKDSYLVLIALGPTATVLSYDLSEYGIQAFDLGHLDVFYDWCTTGAITKTIIQNKYVNEVKGGRINSDSYFNNEKYFNEIINKIL